MKGVKKEDLDNLSVEKRLKIAVSLMQVLQKNVNKLPNRNVFTQININKAGKEDLENSLLNYAQSQKD
jgi:hypothetical protein